MIGSLFFLGGLVVLFAFVAAYVLDVTAQRLEWRRRALLAALMGGLAPMLLPLVVIVLNSEPRSDIVIIVVALLGFAAVLAAAIGFPVAYWFTRRCERSRAPDVFK